MTGVDIIQMLAVHLVVTLVLAGVLKDPHGPNLVAGYQTSLASLDQASHTIVFPVMWVQALIFLLG
jgi:hypothetical protein